MTVSFAFTNLAVGWLLLELSEQSELFGVNQSHLNDLTSNF